VIDPTSPWLRVKTEGAAYAKRGPRFLMREIKAGRLRAARVGGRGEYLTTRQWIDAWFENLATPVVINVRRRV